MGFVDDGTNFEPVFNLAPIPLGQPRQGFMDEAKLNRVYEALRDLRAWAINGNAGGLAPQSAPPAFTGLSPYNLFVRASDNHLVYNMNGTLVDLLSPTVLSGTPSFALGPFNGVGGAPSITVEGNNFGGRVILNMGASATGLVTGDWFTLTLADGLVAPAGLSVAFSPGNVTTAAAMNNFIYDNQYYQQSTPNTWTFGMFSNGNASAFNAGGNPWIWNYVLKLR